MTPSQRRFLYFHAASSPVQWRWHFLGTQLRATSERGKSVTLWRDELRELLQQGLLAASHGESVVVTESGRRELEKETADAG
jgi:hypothetical protein